MANKNSKSAERIRRHVRIRTKVAGTPERPRLAVFRSNANIHAQIIDDSTGVTLAASSSVALKLANGGNIDAAKQVGDTVAKLALDKNIKSVVFDRGGYIYHGRIKALADAAREAGLEF